LAIVAMNDECNRGAGTRVDKNHNHLTVALGCPVVGACAVGRCQTCILQIERTEQAQAGIRQAMFEPLGGRFAGHGYGPGRCKGVHVAESCLECRG
jgi:hypothetical protein